MNLKSQYQDDDAFSQELSTFCQQRENSRFLHISRQYSIKLNYYLTQRRPVLTPDPAILSRQRVFGKKNGQGE
jgi:hypothetical protein